MCEKKRSAAIIDCCASVSDPGGARTLDPLIKSQLLYQLSHGVITVCFGFAIAKVRQFFKLAMILPKKMPETAKKLKNH